MSSKLSALPPTPSPDPGDLMYIVRPVEGPNGSKQITNDALFSTITNNIADKALRFDQAPVTPSIAAPGTGAIAFLAPGVFAISENGGPYKNLFSGIGRGLTPNVTQIGYTSGDNSPLQVNIIPPGAFKSVGDYVEVYMAGGLANNTNTKQVFVIFGPTAFPDLTVFDTPIISITGGGEPTNAGPTRIGWNIYGKIVLTPASVIRSTFMGVFGANLFTAAGVNQGVGSVVTSEQSLRDFAGADLSGVTFEIDAFARGVAADDVTQFLTTITVYNF